MKWSALWDQDSIPSLGLLIRGRAGPSCPFTGSVRCCRDSTLKPAWTYLWSSPHFWSEWINCPGLVPEWGVSSVTACVLQTNEVLGSCVASCGLPWQLSGKEPVWQCRRCRRRGFHPWVGKIPWRRKWQSTPIFLPGKSHGQRNLVGSSPWDLKRVGHDWVTKKEQQ